MLIVHKIKLAWCEASMDLDAAAAAVAAIPMDQVDQDRGEPEPHPPHGQEEACHLAKTKIHSCEHQRFGW